MNIVETRNLLVLAGGEYDLGFDPFAGVPLRADGMPDRRTAKGKQAQAWFDEMNDYSLTVESFKPTPPDYLSP